MQIPQRPPTHLSLSSEKMYFPAIDGLRFLAFLLVFVHHLPRSTNPILALLHDQGWVGVHVFLFLSAYLLTAILRTEQNAIGTISISNFYIRRGLRIWPLYLIFCVGALMLQNFRQPQLPTDWFRFGGLMVFLDNIIAGLRGYNQIPYTGHLWTISLEQQFYLVLPLLLVWLLPTPSRLLRGLFACWVLFICLRIFAVLFQAPHPMIWTSVFSADSLLLGAALGVMQPSPPSKVFARITIVILGAVALFSGALLPPIDKVGAHQVIIYTLIAAGAAALTTAALHEPILDFLKVRPLSYLGKISYGLYVFHMLGIAIGSKVMNLFGSASWWVGALNAFIATTFLSVLSYELIERHFLNLKRRFESVHSRPI